MYVFGPFTGRPIKQVGRPLGLCQSSTASKTRSRNPEVYVDTLAGAPDRGLHGADNMFDERVINTKILMV